VNQTECGEGKGKWVRKSGDSDENIKGKKWEMGREPEKWRWQGKGYCESKEEK